MGDLARSVARRLRTGDTLAVTRTFRLVGIDGNRYIIADVSGGPTAKPTLEELTEGSINLRIVERAKPPQRQQFRVGQVISSDTLREVMWVRGTVIERDNEHRAAFVLRGDGKWHDLLGPGRDCECATGWPFEDFSGDYRLVRLP